jgi:hypothetical protein
MAVSCKILNMWSDGGIVKYKHYYRKRSEMWPG